MNAPDENPEQSPMQASTQAPAARRPRLRVVPVSFAQACAFVDEVHRHHARPQGHKFSIGLLDQAGGRVGVAIVGRPVARHLDDGWTLEVTRLAADGSPNACSVLYGAAWRTAPGAGLPPADHHHPGR